MIPPFNADYLIVGHGIAGLLLGHFLEEAGAQVTYIDAPTQVAATQVAAGIINPITGRRYVKSWRIDELAPFAEQTYRQLEKTLGISFYHSRPLIRTLFNRGEENDWQARQLDPDYANYYHDPVELGAIPELTTPAFSYLQVAQTAQVSIHVLEQALRQKRLASGQLHERLFDYKALKIKENQVIYEDISAKRIVFCEGWRSRFNPYFQHLPFGGNKGEILLIRLPEAKLERLFKHRLFLVPFEEDLYWVGSTSDNAFTDDQPSAAGGEYLRQRLAEILTTPYEIVDHRAAVRPTVRDRRPFLGQHSEHSPLWLFNGLGTKGASLGPFWAKHLANCLLKGEDLDKEVDIRRFENNV